jgi:hypothetical protein
MTSWRIIGSQALLRLITMLSISTGLTREIGMAAPQFREVAKRHGRLGYEKRVADLLVETLQAAGVKTCYGIVHLIFVQLAVGNQDDRARPS